MPFTMDIVFEIVLLREGGIGPVSCLAKVNVF